MAQEEAFVFECEGEDLVGILHRPDAPAQIAIMMIVGGPQYRVGSHRQFIEYARAMADQGIAVMRFDYRGMGDSSGPFLEFEEIEVDVSSAMSQLLARVPSIDQCYWFGLCDAASAALMYAAENSRVDGLILLNPWVRSAQSHAQAEIKNYYGERLFNKAFWKKLATGQINVFATVLELAKKFRTSRTQVATTPNDFRLKMLAGAQRFAGHVLLIMSGDDLTAREFDSLVSTSSDWQNVSGANHWHHHRIADANHTFSNTEWKREVVDKSIEFITHVESN